MTRGVFFSMVCLKTYSALARYVAEITIAIVIMLENNITRILTLKE